MWCFLVRERMMLYTDARQSHTHTHKVYFLPTAWTLFIKQYNHMRGRFLMLCVRALLCLCLCYATLQKSSNESHMCVTEITHGNYEWYVKYARERLRTRDRTVYEGARHRGKSTVAILKQVVPDTICVCAPPPPWPWSWLSGCNWKWTDGRMYLKQMRLLTKKTEYKTTPLVLCLRQEGIFNHRHNFTGIGALEVCGVTSLTINVCASST